MRELCVAAIQMEVTKDKETNIKTAFDNIRTAVRRGAKAVLLPEAWYSGTLERQRSKEEVSQFFINEDDEVVKKLCALAKELNVFIIGGALLIKDNGKVYERVPIISNKGEIIDWVGKGAHENEPVKSEYYHGVSCTENPGYKVYDTEIGKIAVVVDIDMCSPEVPRILGLKEAEVIFWPLGWTAEAIRSIEIDACAASLVSDAYVVVACQVGWNRHFNMDFFHGGSGVIQHRGYISKVADDNEGIALSWLDLDLIPARREGIREGYPHWRRPDTYGLLCDVEAEEKVRGGLFK